MSVQPVSRPAADINVTPLVDVVLVLLIIFMVVTPLLRAEMAVRLPQTQAVESAADVPPDQLLVSVGPQGELLLNAEVLDEASYVERIRSTLAARRTGERVVFFRAADQAPYPRVIHALEGARQAGAETLGIVSEPEEANPAR